MIHHKAVIQELGKKHGFGPAMAGGWTGLLIDRKATMMNQIGTEKTWPNLCTGSEKVGM